MDNRKPSTHVREGLRFFEPNLDFRGLGGDVFWSSQARAIDLRP